MNPVAFIGLGNMGAPMALNLLRGKVPLFVYNRSPEKLEPFIKAGAKPLRNPEEAFQKADTVITMLANDQAVEEISESLYETVRRGCIHLSMSTISPKTSHKLEALFNKKGAHYLAAPVFGRPEAAEKAKLMICIAGHESAKKWVEPILKLMGESIEDFGHEAKAANIVKLAGNFLLLSAIEAMGEAFALGEKNGISPEKMASFFGEKHFKSPIYQNYGKIIASKAFEKVGMKMTLGLKDISLVNDTAHASDTSMPVAEVLRTLMQEGIAHGRENYDWTAITLSAQDKKD